MVNKKAAAASKANTVTDEEAQNLIKAEHTSWQRASLEHHCPICQKPLAAPKARSCVGEHVEVCQSFHPSLHRCGWAKNCNTCKTEDNFHLKRHRVILNVVKTTWEQSGGPTLGKKPFSKATHWSKVPITTNLTLQAINEILHPETGDELENPPVTNEAFFEMTARIASYMLQDSYQFASCRHRLELLVRHDLNAESLRVELLIARRSSHLRWTHERSARQLGISQKSQEQGEEVKRTPVPQSQSKGKSSYDSDCTDEIGSPSTPSNGSVQLTYALCSDSHSDPDDTVGTKLPADTNQPETPIKTVPKAPAIQHKSSQPSKSNENENDSSQKPDLAADKVIKSISNGGDDYSANARTTNASSSGAPCNKKGKVIPTTIKIVTPAGYSVVTNPADNNNPKPLNQSFAEAASAKPAASAMQDSRGNTFSALTTPESLSTIADTWPPNLDGGYKIAISKKTSDSKATVGLPRAANSKPNADRSSRLTLDREPAEIGTIGRPAEPEAPAVQDNNHDRTSSGNKSHPAVAKPSKKKKKKTKKASRNTVQPGEKNDLSEDAFLEAAIKQANAERTELETTKPKSNTTQQSCSRERPADIRDPLWAYERVRAELWKYKPGDMKLFADCGDTISAMSFEKRSDIYWQTQAKFGRYDSHLAYAFNALAGEDFLHYKKSRQSRMSMVGDSFESVTPLLTAYDYWCRGKSEDDYFEAMEPSEHILDLEDDDMFFLTQVAGTCLHLRKLWGVPDKSETYTMIRLVHLYDIGAIVNSWARHVSGGCDCPTCSRVIKEENRLWDYVEQHYGDSMLSKYNRMRGMRDAFRHLDKIGAHDIFSKQGLRVAMAAGW